VVPATIFMVNSENKEESALYTSLKELGLSDPEANLYAVSLKLGPSSISELAKNVNVSRPNVYKIIEGLQMYGLASFYGKEKYARNFMVESPTIVFEKLQAKKESLNRLGHQIVTELPELLALYQQGGKDTKIKILKGREQYVRVFLQTADETANGGVIEFFGSAEDFIGLTGWDTEKIWIKKRIKKNISVKSLVPPGSVAMLKKNQEDELREVRIYSGNFSFSTAFELFGNKMIVWQPVAPLAVLIEDQYIVSMFRSIFYTLWGKSK
jgi:sugar-specific transcriptional regulator TrmB